MRQGGIIYLRLLPFYEALEPHFRCTLCDIVETFVISGKINESRVFASPHTLKTFKPEVFKWDITRSTSALFLRNPIQYELLPAKYPVVPSMLNSKPSTDAKSPAALLVTWDTSAASPERSDTTGEATAEEINANAIALENFMMADVHYKIADSEKRRELKDNPSKIWIILYVFLQPTAVNRRNENPT